MFVDTLKTPVPILTLSFQTKCTYSKEGVLLWYTVKCETDCVCEFRGGIDRGIDRGIDLKTRNRQFA